MSTVDSSDEFVLDAVDLDGVEVGQDEDGRLTATRDLANDQIELEDVIDLAHEHGLDVVNVVTDMQAVETRLILGRGSA